MKFLIIVTRKGQGGQAGLGNLYREFLQHLPDHCVFGGLTLFDLAARKFPKPSHRLAIRPLGDKDALVLIDKRARGHKEQSGHALAAISYGNPH